MSDADDDKDVLAAEYVLGTLDADDRANAHMLMAIDPDFAASIVRWERRLGELHALVESVDPPPATWEWIKARIATVPQSPQLWMPGLEEAAAAAAARIAAPEASLDPVPLPVPPASAQPASVPPAPAEAAPARPRADAAVLARRVRRWRWATALVLLLALGAAGAAAVRELRPELVPEQFRQEPVIVEKPVEVIREVIREVPSQQMAEYVAVFPGEDGKPGFLLTMDAARRVVTVRRLDDEPPQDRSHELWIMTQKAPEPRSLGVVDGEPFTVRDGIGDYDVVALSHATFGISLEPYGGSPNGKPSGPMLESKLIQATPAAYPAATP